MESAPYLNPKTVCVCLGGVVLSECFFAWLFHFCLLSTLAQTFLIRCFQLVFLVLTVWFFHRDFSVVGLAPQKIWRGFLKGCVWSLVFGAIVALVFGVVLFTGNDPFSFFRTSARPNFLTGLLYFFAAICVAPFVEEFLFRGIFYTFFRSWGILFALFTTTALFAILHLPQGGIPWIQIIGGFVFAVSYEREGSLMTPMVIHVTGNLALFILSLL